MLDKFDESVKKLNATWRHKTFKKKIIAKMVLSKTPLWELRINIKIDNFTFTTLKKNT